MHEDKKTIVKTTLNHALLRASIHVLPICVSIMLIWMNLRDVNIGPALNFSMLTTTNSLASTLR